MEEILMLKNVSVFYGEHPVLKDVNMGIRPGRILAVMGPSGSGKTTLLRTLGEELAEVHTVLLCTTTKILPFSDLPCARTAAELEELARVAVGD